MKPIHMMAALLVALCWGGNFAASKYVLEYLPPVLTIMLRYVAVAALLLPFVGARQLRWRQLFIQSFLMITMHFTLIFTAIWMGLDIASTVIAVQLGAPFTCVLSTFIFNDKLGPWRTSGMAVAFLGVIAVAGTPNAATHWHAFLIAIIGAFSWGASNVYMKMLGEVKIMSLIAWTGLASLPQLVVLSLLFEGNQIEAILSAPLTVWAGLGYTVVFSTFVAYGLWYWLIKKYDMSQVAPFSLLVPVGGIWAAHVMFGEELTARMLTGCALTIIGVGIINLRRPKLLGAPDKL